MVIPNAQLTKMGVSSTVKRFKGFFIFLFIILLVPIIIVLLDFLNVSREKSIRYEKIKLDNILNPPVHVIKKNDQKARPTNARCSHWDCFDIYKCGRTGHDRITIYVYPLNKYLDEDNNPILDIMSKQYYMILQSIIDSKYYTANPNEACLFVPSIDTLSQERINLNLTSKALKSLSK